LGRSQANNEIELLRETGLQLRFEEYRLQALVHSILHAMGIKPSSFADSTGVLHDSIFGRA
jgi:hypothetical protein